MAETDSSSTELLSEFKQQTVNVKQAELRESDQQNISLVNKA